MEKIDGKKFEHVKNWIFDLDDTLYPYDSMLWKQIEDNIRDYISDYMNISPEEAYEKQIRYYKTFGTTLSGLMKETEIDPEIFVDAVHELDLSVLKPNPALKEALDKLPGRKFVFTNGAHKHGHNVTKQLGIHDCFDGFFGAKDTDFIPKPDIYAYEKMLKHFEINPKEATFFEDNQKNLRLPHEMGMRTVWIRNSSKEHNASTVKPDFCDYEIESLVNCINEIVASIHEEDNIIA